MALIYIYDATELDKKQLDESLRDTDHHWEYVPDRIAPDNCNPEAEVISVFVTSTISREVIEAMPKLKLIALRSTGFNNVDFSATKEHGITVVNVPTYGNETVAEYAFAMLLALTRKIQKVLETENNNFEPNELTGTDLKGKVFGSLGTGNIGQKSLQIAKGFDMETIAFDAFPKEGLDEQLGFKYVTLDELLQRADVVSLHVPLLPSTQHIMSREQLEKMKQGAILINTARGELVETKALVELLENGHLGGAAIDVVEGEELLNLDDEVDILFGKTNSRGTLKHSVEIDILKKMPNVIISPHNAYNTAGAIGRINHTTAKNIIDFWYGQTPNLVKPPKKQPGKLLVARHTESEWNASGIWTGTRDAHLSGKGFKDAGKLGEVLKDLNIKIDVAYCSEQIRSRETLEGMLDSAGQLDVETIVSPAINERDYGDYTGKNKWDMKELLGEETWQQIRRGWNIEIPGGETLKAVYERAVPFYETTIVPQLLAGKNILLVAHGNSIRALMKYIEDINDDDVSKLEMLLGQIIVYDVDDKGKKQNSSVVKIDTEASPKA